MGDLERLAGTLLAILFSNTIVKFSVSVFTWIKYRTISYILFT